MSVEWKREIPAEDGFYFVRAASEPTEVSIVHRLGGKFWRFGNGEPLSDESLLEGLEIARLETPFPVVFKRALAA
jgi:hypothetical protein